MPNWSPIGALESLARGTIPVSGSTLDMDRLLQQVDWLDNKQAPGADLGERTGRRAAPADKNK